jgi:hypothetical protein
MSIIDELERDTDDLWQSAAMIVGCNPTEHANRRIILVFHEMVSDYLQHRGSSYEQIAPDIIQIGGRLQAAVEWENELLRPNSPELIKAKSFDVFLKISMGYPQLWECAAKIARTNPTNRENDETIASFSKLVKNYLKLRGHTFKDMAEPIKMAKGRLLLALDYENRKTSQAPPAPNRQPKPIQPAAKADGIFQSVNQVRIDQQNELNNVAQLAKEAIKVKKHLFNIVGASSPLLINNPGELKKHILKLRTEINRSGDKLEDHEKILAINSLLGLIKDQQLMHYKAKLAQYGMPVIPATRGNYTVETPVKGNKNPSSAQSPEAFFRTKGDTKKNNLDAFQKDFLNPINEDDDPFGFKDDDDDDEKQHNR